jgi:hypothetical protein
VNLGAAADAKQNAMHVEVVISEDFLKLPTQLHSISPLGTSRALEGFEAMRSQDFVADRWCAIGCAYCFFILHLSAGGLYRILCTGPRGCATG